MRGPYQSASAHVVTSMHRSGYYRLERQLPGGVCTRKESAPFHGAHKKSSKVLQDCTICRSCREAVIGPVVLKWRTNRVKWRTFGGPLTLRFTGVPVRRHQGAVPFTGERLSGTRRSSALASAIVEAARGVCSPSVNAVMTAAHWLIERHIPNSNRRGRSWAAYRRENRRAARRPTPSVS